ncbi:hypothetical protein A3J90_05960 [candidate division WOR-1 bacterium RIFOXYC2_FULL_37_10]|uniref:Uncharacterized protein n=1 Tax=candidate division WOR-1 bacterium RIFOXYB2_FULL_37_13 TaxID=1802579 RepID=A0A1F4SWK9_UNCSA|nr:MAG: hypothetical protein A2246_06435 [candidate division WOR-1 bacterium RIFOXYA2_FULL_37_7]OGC24838.1 MAG: hypothetical protein A2310_03765 [candidate division WOR-1 bacterium RIFOXYB2_FULL_37_13]OGC34930.1 MAG: hypothetical protein A3J90_05960 [candidate division WOR-1 bacterium RIFOXYC2_FULL_37_10]
MFEKPKKLLYLYYEDIFSKMGEKGIKYLLIGGVAVNLHGIQRATGDIDLLLAMDKENILKFVDVTKELGLVPKVPIKAETIADAQKLKQLREEKNMQVFSFMHPDSPYICIDIMTENYIAAGRPQDIADIEALEKYGERE